MRFKAGPETGFETGLAFVDTLESGGRRVGIIGPLSFFPAGAIFRVVSGRFAPAKGCGELVAHTAGASAVLRAEEATAFDFPG